MAGLGSMGIKKCARICTCISKQADMHNITIQNWNLLNLTVCASLEDYLKMHSMRLTVQDADKSLVGVLL
jgi:hypothetical protein